MDIAALINVFKKRFWVMVTVVAIGCTLASLYGMFMVTPTYSATTKMIVNKSNGADGAAGAVDLNSINTSIILANTYKEIIKTSAILERVVAEYPEIGATESELSEKVKVSAIAGTQLITATIQDTSHARAAKIVNALSEVFKTQIPKIMNVDNVTILSATKVSDDPVLTSTSLKFIIVLGFLVSGLLAVGLALLLESLDDTLKTEQEVLQYLGVPALAAISSVKRSDMRRGESRSHVVRRGETQYVGSHK